MLWVGSPPTHTPKKKIYWSPNPSECLYRDNPVKVRSLGWARIQYGWCPYKKKRKIWTHRHTQGENHRKIKADETTWMDVEGITWSEIRLRKTNTI